MEFKELTTDSLSETLANSNKVMVQYGAAWCGSCRLTKPKFKRLAGDNEEIQFVYVDAEKFQESRKLAEIKNLPTFAGFVNGTLVMQQAGSKIENITEVVDAVANN